METLLKCNNFSRPQDIAFFAAGLLGNFPLFCVLNLKPLAKGCASTSECGIVTVRDSDTIEIARSIADTIEELLGSRPYLVINNLNRFEREHSWDK